MSTSPLDPQDIRAAAEVYGELGPEYNDEVVAAFIDRVDRAVAARVEARLAEERRGRPAARAGRRTLLRGVALGVCAGALVAGIGVSHTHVGITHRSFAHVVPYRGSGPGPGVPRPVPVPPPPPPAVS
ncbi:MAG TPA: hypothetical protein VK836_03750 [Streptosporangiaceae bacterium]|jgi:hypothetical protein|nr:hypothetical protein [Streptosporangiaceae bacterium]